MTKCGYVTIIGIPNAGKSTLTNYLVGEKITIVTRKVQTTRSTIKAILTEDDTQIIFKDTPGIFAAKQNLEKAIVENALANISQDGEILFLIDAKNYDSEDNKIIFEYLLKLNKKFILAINKSDILDQEKISELAEKYSKHPEIEKLFFISALRGKNLDELKSYLKSKMPISEFLYPEEEITTKSSRFIAQEITREKVFLFLHKELPYNITVETISFKEGKKSITIDQVIYVMKDSQKLIVIGHKGEIIKKLGIIAREAMEKFFDCKINLFLHVKVKENWTDLPYMYNHMEINFPKDNKNKKWSKKSKK
jgi:GTPase